MRVLLLEAGGRNSGLLIKMPGGIGQLVSRKSAANWGFQSAKMGGLGGRSLFVARGRGLGGSSSINGMLYVRGHARDYDLWAQSGLPGWSYADVLPYFRRSENFAGGANTYHGTGGPLHVASAAASDRLNLAFMEASEQAGLSYTSDFNGAQQEGYGCFQVNIEGGQRAGALRAFLKPASKHSNLDILTGARVNRIVIENGRAVGVEYRRHSRTEIARCHREVVLCAGAIQSPQILMLSGIGNGQELRDHGIEVVRDLPGVGKNLQDHLDVAAAYTCSKPVSLYSRTKGYRAGLIGLQYLLTRKGLGASNGMDAGAFFKSRQEVETPDIQLHFVAGIMGTGGEKEMVKQDGFSIDVTPLRPISRGSVGLTSPDPLKPPLIDLNLLDEHEDIETLKAGFRCAVRIAEQPAFDTYREKPYERDIDINNDAELEPWLRANASTVFHPVGTASMGLAENRSAVVGADLKVHGLDALRVIDASIMPRIVSGNTNAATMMIAEKAADLMLGKTPLPARPTANSDK